jgi:hypothetical protein
MGWRWCFRTDGQNGPKRILRRKEDAKLETAFAVKILGNRAIELDPKSADVISCAQIAVIKCVD